MDPDSPYPPLPPPLGYPVVPTLFVEMLHFFTELLRTWLKIN